MGGDTAPSTIPRSPCLHTNLPCQTSTNKESPYPFQNPIQHKAISKTYATWNTHCGINTPRPRETHPTILLQIGADMRTQPAYPMFPIDQILVAHKFGPQPQDVHTHHNIRAYTKETHNSHPTINKSTTSIKRFSRR